MLEFFGKFLEASKIVLIGGRGAEPAAEEEKLYFPESAEYSHGMPEKAVFF